MSQNEVSVFGSKMVTLREKTDTSFWDIPTCFGVDLGTRVVQVDKNIHLQWLKFKQSFFSDFDIWGPDMISVWKLVSTTSLKFCLWGPHHVPQCHVVWIQLDPRVNQRFGQGEEPQSMHRIKTIKETGAGWGWEIGINLFSEQTSYLDQWVWTPYHLVTWNSPFLTLSTIWNFSAMVSLERAFRTLGSGLQRPIKCRSLAAAVCLADKAVKHWFGQGDKKTKGKTLYNTWLNLAQNLDGLQSGTVGKAPYFWDTSTLHGVEEIGSYASLVLSELAWHWLIIIFGFSRVWLALADNDNTDKVKYKYEHTWSK